MRRSHYLLYVLIVLLTALAVLSTTNCRQANAMTANREVPEYHTLWKEVNGFYQKGLPRSALKVVEKIYDAAEKHGDAAQFIKALLYKMRFIQDVEEDTFVKVQKELNDELKNSRFPITPVLHSILAEQYWNYYMHNRYRILKRTTAADFKEEDIRTWDAKKIVEAVFFHYGKSLENTEKSKKTKIDIFDEIIYKGNSRQFRPTLYDFLAHRAIDFYMSSEAGLTKPRYQFTLNNPDYFLSTAKFAGLKLFTRDTLSFHFRALTYLQDLVTFHLDDKYPDALLDVDLKRLRFVYHTAVISNKDIIYEETLREMLKMYGKSTVSAEIYYELALLYNRLGDKYKPGSPNTENYREHKKKAYELCQEAVKTYPGSPGAINCHALIYQIEGKDLTLNLEKVTEPGKPSRALVNYRNLDKVFLKVVKSYNLEILNKRRLSGKELVSYFTGKQAVKNWQVALPDDKDYQPHSTEIKIEGLELGEYVILASTNSDFDFRQNTNSVAYGFFTVSNISYISRKREDKGWEFYLMDRDTGQPLKNAAAQLLYREYRRDERKYTDREGKRFDADAGGYLAICPGSVEYTSFYLEFIHGEDRLYSDRDFSFYTPHRSHRNDVRTIFFTDRAIYRPGQTVYFKGIMLQVDSQEGEKSKILENYSTRVTLYDVNHQKVNELSLRTNEYGTFSGTFQLPTGRLNGNMRITDGHGSVDFSMEEYKRPKFKVGFQPLEKSYRLHDKVTVKGEAKAYAGYNIDNAEVKFRVIRNVFYPYPWYWYRWGGYLPRSPEMEIANGFTKTGAGGTFDVTFEAVPDLALPKESRPGFCFTVYADVTDINGETRSSQKKVYIGYTALKLAIGLAEELDKDQKEYKVSIDSTNLSGEFVPAKGNIAIYKLMEPERIFRKRFWKKPDKFVIHKKDYYAAFPYDVYNDENDIHQWERQKKVFALPFDTAASKQFILPGLRRWETGKYLAEMKSLDRFGNEVKEITYFTVFSSGGKRVPFKTADWFTVVKGTAEPGEKAIMLIGSAEKNVRVIYEVEHQGHIVEKKYLSLNNRQEKIEIPIKEEHRGNLGVHFTFIRHNRFFVHSYNILVPWSNKKLDISFETFRDKLKPGEKEQWRLKIKGPKGAQAAAEMVASLYDASLDAFRANRWNFDVFPHHYLGRPWEFNSYFNVAYLVGKQRKSYSYFRKTYDRLNWFGFYWREYSLRNRVPGRRQGGVERYKALAPPARKVLPQEQEQESVEGMSADKRVLSAKIAGTGKKRNGEKEPETPVEEKETELPPVQIRTNFNETAFFYPHLRTTPGGDILISFTIPEALTKWKMMGFAHTRNLENGFVFNELVTQKELMVVPNTPRFFREGDTIIYTSKITNLADKELTGTARLQLFDAVTMQPKDALFKNLNPEKSFTAKKGQSALVKWKILIPEDLDAVTYRLVASAGRFSDGEEQAVPILKNRMLVTESLPLPVRAKQTKAFTFDKLVNAAKSKTLKHHKLTLEFTSNPVWYAVQALPYLMEYPHECTEQIFSRYYANSIASYIVNSNAKIKKVFDIWKNAPKDSANANALLSNLEKNQELKTVLLEETPWVLNGRNETQRKRRVALLFDLNSMAAQLGRALKKLKEGQKSSGGWPWFKGMGESRYITQHIVCGFAHLGVLKVVDVEDNQDIRQMVKKAVPYLDKKITEDYQWLLQHNIDLKKNHLSYIQVHYLYARSYFRDIPMDDLDKKAFEYYKSQVKTFWVDFSGSKYMQGMMALIMKRYNDTETATAIAESIKEHALYSEEMGMYWKTGYGYYWYQAPIETHALLVEMFTEVLNDMKSVEALKTWLLKQKQTQDWRTTKATVEACYALLLKGEDWLKESRPPEITLGQKRPIVIVPGKEGADGERTAAEAGTGYFKTAWTGRDIKPEMGMVKVKNNNNIVAWGSLYWQYFENLDKITPAKTPLHLKKKLFVEKPSDTGPVIFPLKDSTRLKVGDRIKVRIELRVDRNMEYVHMKDMRASSLEPEQVISGYRWQDGLGYYQSTKDASTNFFFDYIRKGTYVFEYPLRVTHEGDFSNGITVIQCMYAPEFTSHSEGVRVAVGR